MIPAQAVEFTSITVDYSLSTYVETETKVEVVVSK